MARVCKRCEHPNAEDAKFCRECGNMLEVDSGPGVDPLVGRVIHDRYRIKSVLGEGGMGKVYLAEQKMGTITREVAIKTLHPELSGDPQLVARFHRECETVIQLQHPNTVKFYDFGSLEDRTLFIVMELIRGEDLSKVVERGPMDPARVDRLLIQICGALAEAHQRGIVHRDLKPENVLLTHQGGQTDFVKVLDFGIAKPGEGEDQDKPKLTKQGMVLGTPPYMSPEQFTGGTLDQRSDIYSLGVMTFEMVTGHLPFEANTPWEWATRHMTNDPRPLETFPAGAALAPHKKAAILRALSKDPARRQGTVLEFMQEFTAIGDPQAAWTMATSSAISHPGLAAVSSPRTPVGTPQPMSASQPGTRPITDPMAATAMNLAAPPTPAHGVAMGGGMPTHSPMTSTGGSGLAKILVVLGAVLVLLGGLAGAGIWILLGRSPELAEGPVAAPIPVGAIPSGTAGGAPSGVPATPPTPDPAPEPTPTADPTAADPTPPPPEPVGASAMVDPAPSTPEPSPTPMNTSAAMRPDPRPSRADGDRAQGMAAVRRGRAALAQNDLDGTVQHLRAAQRALGRGDGEVRSLQGDLGRRASNKVGILMQQGRCRPAQELFTALRSVGAEGPSRRHFSDDWCRQP